MDNEKMIENIRTLCKSNNISPAKLEEELGFSQGLISRWKDKTPSIDKIIDIADYFHISLDEVVGRNENNINDGFIKALYEKTINKEITWKTFEPSTDESGIIQYTQDFEYLSPMEEEEYKHFCDTHKEKSYYFEYIGGYISIYALYEYHDITKPKELKLFIQPDIRAEIIQQPFDKSELLPLWLKVLISLEDNAPDEIKAEDLKSSFIQNAIRKPVPNTKKIEIDTFNQMLDNPEIIQLIQTMNTPEMLKLKEMFIDPKFQASVQAANKLQQYFSKINGDK